MESTMNSLAATTQGTLPAQTSVHIFSKAHEFGADETKFTEKINCLGHLLPNYGGLGGMKNEFAQMLYSSSSRLFISKNGSEILEDVARMNRQQKVNLKESLEQQMVEMITNKELKSRQERSKLEIFDV